MLQVIWLWFGMFHFAEILIPVMLQTLCVFLIRQHTRQFSIIKCVQRARLLRPKKIIHCLATFDDDEDLISI